MRRVLSEDDLREFRERVCAAAADLLAEHGYQGFNMRELAARLDVSAMTTYRYFDSKDEIFAALGVQAFNRLASRLEGLLDLPVPLSERFVAFCRGYVEFARNEPVRYRLMFDHARPEIARSADLADAERRMFRAFAQLTGSMARNGQTELRPERLAQMLWASLHGLAGLANTEAFSDCELDGLLLDLIDRFPGRSSLPAEFERAAGDSATKWQPNGIDRNNGASRFWMPVTAAE